MLESSTRQWPHEVASNRLQGQITDRKLEIMEALSDTGSYIATARTTEVSFADTDTAAI
jgi:hypothetical protein